MAEISIYKADETDFTHNGIVLKDAIYCEVEEELNGKYVLELKHPISDNDMHLRLKEENIIKADGQLFRIYSSIGNLGYIEVKARHIFYDLLHNFLEDVRPTELNLNNALNWVLDNTQYPHKFKGVSDVGVINTQYFIRRNPVEAILGADSLSTRWGGEIVRDNFTIRMLRARGSNKGAQIAYSKNLMGLEVERDMDSVATRIMPVGKEELILPEKFIDSPLIDSYNEPYIKVVQLDIGVQEAKVDKDGVVIEEAISQEQAYVAMRQAVNDLYEFEKVDIPYVNIKADLALLENTEEYKDLKHLVKVELGDVVSCTDNPLGITFEAKVIRVKKDILANKNIEVELGQFKKGLSDTIKDVVDKVREEIEGSQSDLEASVERATDLITNALGGHVVKRAGEILIMDTDDPLTAVKIWRFNLNGLGYSSSGINGPYRLAMTMDGEFVADFITTGVLNASLIKNGMLKSQTGDMWINMENGHFKLGGMEQDDDGWRVQMEGLPLDEYIETKVNAVSNEYTDTELEALKKLMEEANFEGMKREIQGRQKEIDIRYNTTYSNPQLILAGVDSQQKRDLYESFNVLYGFYTQLIVDLDSAIANASELMKTKVRVSLNEYLNYMTTYDNVFKNAVEYINTSTDDKIAAARQKADNSLSRLAEYNDDRYWTPFEKRMLKEDVDLIKREYPKIKSEADALDVATYSYTTAYNELVRIMDLVLHTMGETTYHAGGNSRLVFTDYYNAKIDLLKAIDTAKNLKVSNVGAAAARAEAAASVATSNANDAISEVSAANALISDIASDGKVIPKEKKDLSREMNVIRNERDGIVNEAQWYGVSSYQYRTLYTQLDNYITPILDNMNITTAVNRDTLILRFTNYYNAKMTLLNDIAAEAKTLLDDKVAKDGIPAAINLNAGTASIQGSKINLTGAVTVLSDLSPNSDLGTINAGLLTGPRVDVDLNNGHIRIDSDNSMSGFRLRTPSGQVAIDGETNMFKIVSQGTMSVWINDGSSSSNERKLTHNASVGGKIPAFLAYQVDTISTLPGGVPLPALTLGRELGDLKINGVVRASIDNNYFYLQAYRNGTSGQIISYVTYFILKEMLD